MTTPGEYEAQRLAAASATYRTKVAILKAIRDETTADHCSHGVARNLCIDHRPSRATTQEPT